MCNTADVRLMERLANQLHRDPKGTASTLRERKKKQRTACDIPNMQKPLTAAVQLIKSKKSRINDKETKGTRLCHATGGVTKLLPLRPNQIQVARHITLQHR